MSVIFTFQIDLLAAARCNMFSHVLVAYMTELKKFAEKSSTTFDTIAKTLEQRPKYDFCVLKELSQHEDIQESSVDLASFDSDQTLFFAVSALRNRIRNVNFLMVFNKFIFFNLLQWFFNLTLLKIFI